MAFFQEPPALANPYTADPVLGTYLRRHLPPDVLSATEGNRERMGELASGRLLDLAVRHQRDKPVHVARDPWGNRVDRIEVNDAWKAYARVAAEEGLLATAYERAHGGHSRLVQFALVYLFAPSSQVYTCPLAMTDGCARTLETLGPPHIRERVLPRLTTRDPDRAWTSGQWMTERTGGSDVGLSETLARRDGDFWRLYGTKWFTSAVSSEVTLTLARPEGNGPGGKGLALFFLDVRREDGSLNHIRVNRLKEKLGTRNLPTAELALVGTVAEPVAGLQDGVRNMASMLNITRTWNAVCAVAGMRRGLDLARDYARRRVAFGAALADKPLHLETLAGMAAEYEAAFQLVFHTVHMLGRAEAGEAGPEEAAVLRVLHPVAKLLTGKQAVAMASETLECFGGAGYVEDTGLPTLLRDAQVLSIWEGTTNVLSLETFRALQREDAWQPFLEHVRGVASRATGQGLAGPAAAAVEAAEHAMAWAGDTAARDPVAFEAGARGFALTLGRSLSLALLAEHASWCQQHGEGPRAAAAARRFAGHGVDRLLAEDYDAAEVRTLALEGA